MFTIEMLPAREGDALWIEYGDPTAPHRILIDCGYKSTYRTIMKRLRKTPSLTFELMVLTHIDGDHIAGAVPLIADGDVTSDRIKQIWFNGRKMIENTLGMPQLDVLGARQGEYFTKTIDDKGFAWNSSYEGKTIYVQGQVSDSKPLEGGMNLTVLSPCREQLDNLLNTWNTELDALLDGRKLEEMLEIVPGAMQPDVLGDMNIDQLARSAFEPDSTAPNGSSLAFLAEFRDEFDCGRNKRVLFCGDAFSPVLEKSIENLLAQRGADRLQIDALKVSHHGSKGNTSPKLLQLLDCRKFLISTNGSRHSHPDPECIARILKSDRRHIELYFNYCSDVNKQWGAPGQKNKYRYEAYYPACEGEGLIVTI